MFIQLSQLIKIIANRFPLEEEADIHTYIQILIQLLKDRLLKNIPIIITNFGILTRRKFKSRKIGNISNRSTQIIESERILLRPSNSFLDIFKDKDNREYYYNLINRKAKQAVSQNKYKRKKPII